MRYSPLNLARSLRSRLRRGWLTLRIEAKWWRDKRRLPLTPEHRELYEIIHRLCWRELHDFPDLNNCRDFNDRIQWLKLFDQQELQIHCCDKILVRDYVREKVGERYLVKLWQTCDRFEQIDFAALPPAFVIKVNHDSGGTLLVRNKQVLDKEGAAQRISQALGQRYGWTNGEWGYAFIEPRVLVEAFLNPDGKVPPSDYKFYVVEGRVKFVHYIYDRGFGTKEQTVDKEGNDLATELYPSFELGTGFRRPDSWAEMVDVAERLGADFKCVRVDMYYVDGRIYVGELTFWPMAGHYKGEGQKKLGPLLDFDRTSFRPPIYQIWKKRLPAELIAAGLLK